MDSLRNWISPLVEIALRNWLENPNTAIKGLTGRERILPPVDDASNLRIPVEKSKRSVQLLKWSKQTSPIQATISDSSSSIECIFASDAVRRYEKEHLKQDIRRNTTGAILNITGFDIVVCSIITASIDVTLYIREFSVAGCEGSGTFGDPIKISRNRSIVELVHTICKPKQRQYSSESEDYDSDDSDVDVSSGDASDVSSVRSQPKVDGGGFVASHDPSPSSQDNFSTQVPYDALTVAKATPRWATKSPPIIPSKDLLANFRGMKKLASLRQLKNPSASSNHRKGTLEKSIPAADAIRPPSKRAKLEYFHENHSTPAPISSSVKSASLQGKPSTSSPISTANLNATPKQHNNKVTPSINVLKSSVVRDKPEKSPKVLTVPTQPPSANPSATVKQPKGSVAAGINTPNVPSKGDKQGRLPEKHLKLARLSTSAHANAHAKQTRGIANVVATAPSTAKASTTQVKNVSAPDSTPERPPRTDPSRAPENPVKQFEHSVSPADTPAISKDHRNNHKKSPGPEPTPKLSSRSRADGAVPGSIKGVDPVICPPTTPSTNNKHRKGREPFPEPRASSSTTPSCVHVQGRLPPAVPETPRARRTSPGATPFQSARKTLVNYESTASSQPKERTSRQKYRSTTGEAELLILNQEDSGSQIPDPAQENTDAESRPLHKRGKFEGQKRTECPSSDSWYHWKRIRRRDILISKDQEELIERPESWVPPETGKPMPQGHVPVNLLKQWNALAAKHLRASPIAPIEEISMGIQQVPFSSAPSPTPSSELGSDELSSSQWSRSPDRNKCLPPDSPQPTLPPRKLRDPPAPFIHSEPQKRVNESGSRNNEGHTSTRSLDLAPSAVISTELARATEEAVFSSDSEVEESAPIASEIKSSQNSNAAPADTPLNSRPSSPAHQGKAPEGMSPANGTTSDHPEASQESMSLDIPEASQASIEQVAEPPSSEVLVPGTFDNPNSSPPETGTPDNFQTDIPQSSMDTDEDTMLEKQLNAELDSSIISIEQPTQQPAQVDPFKLHVSRLLDSRCLDQPSVLTNSSTDIYDSPRSESSNVPVYGKRKLEAITSFPLGKRAKPSEAEVCVSRSDGIPSSPSSESGRKSSRPSDRYVFAAKLTVSEGRKVYDVFVNAYRDYCGTLEGFKKSCRELLSLYDKGDLKKTSLWDDFVGREQDEYKKYLLKCHRENRLPQSYRAYFLKNVTSARFKKRALTAKAVKSVVDDHQINDFEEPDSQISKTSTVPENDFRIPVTERVGVKGQGELPPPTTITPDGHDIPDGDSSECDERHEMASVELGSPIKQFNATGNDLETASSALVNASEDVNGDVIMDDAGTTSIRSEDYDSMAADITDQRDALRQSFASREKTEVEESDAEKATDTKEIKTVSTESVYQGSQTRDISRSKQDEAICKRNNRGKAKRSSPIREMPLYPPYKPPAASSSSASAGSSPVRGRDCSRRREWWKDPNTEFKSFYRAYLGLQTDMTDPIPMLDKKGVLIMSEWGTDGPPSQGKMDKMGWNV